MVDTDKLTAEIMSGMDCFIPCNMERHVKRLLEKTFYRQVSYYKSHDDVVLVPLRVGDLMGIVEGLYLDADAESHGEIDKYCHNNAVATTRCADQINEVLKSYGWE